jgi:hypothetical protein
MSRALAAFFVVPVVAAALSIGTPVRSVAQEVASPLTMTSERAHDSSELTRRPGDERIGRQDIEIVTSAGRNIPQTLVPQRIESYVNETFTTSKPGRLLVTKSMELTGTCTPTSGVIYFLMIDGVPLRNSAVFSRTGIIGQMSGVTTNAIAAGAHTITVGETCTAPGASITGATVTIIGITSAIVLP